MKQIRKILDKFYSEYNFSERIKHDPIEFPRRYKDPGDIELAGFIASCLAYGKVDLFKPVIEKLLSRMGASPYEFIRSFRANKEGRLFSGIKYRFNENEDIVCLMYILHEILERHASLEAAFMESYRPDDENIQNALTGFMDEIASVNTSVVYGKNIRPASLAQFFPSPAGGSACKRANLFLRWMIRDKDIDFGIWKGIPKNRLVIPLDTHIARISRCLGFTKRKAQDWKAAVEITESLKRLDPVDPLKYDFALCHHGISGACRATKDDSCRSCALRS